MYFVSNDAWRPLPLTGQRIRTRAKRRPAATAAKIDFGRLLLGIALVTAPFAGGSHAVAIASSAAPYRLVFEGNQHLNDKKLQGAAAEELAAFEKHGFRRSDIDDAAYQMQLAYRQIGYAFAEVDYRIQPPPPSVVVAFAVYEGPRVVVASIAFVGNRAVEEKTLRALFEGRRKDFLEGSQLYYVASEIRSARARIQDYYLSNGFLDVRVASPEASFSDERTSAHIRISIQEGPQYRVRDVKITGDPLEQNPQAMEEIRRELIDRPYVRRNKIFLQSRLLNAYQNAGYAYVQAEVIEKAGPALGDILLEAAVTSGPVVTISEIDVRGNLQTREAFIRGRLRLQPGDRYSVAMRQESFRALYKTGLFSEVDLILEPLEDKRTAQLVVQVVEVPSLELYVEPGWGSYERLRLKLGLREKNLLGSGIILNPEAKVSIKAQSLTVRFTDPWFLDTDFTADVPAYYSHREEPSFTREDLGIGVFFSKSLTSAWKTTVGYNLRLTDLSEVTTDALDPVTGSDYDLGSVEAQATYDTRDDLFFPLQGTRFFLAAERADTLFGGSITFLRLTGGVRLFYRLLQETVLGLHYKTGWIIPGTDEVELPISERFFNGGENTVRSFKESDLGPKNVFGEPVGGYGHNVFNIEIRQRIYRNFIGAAFADVGNVAPNSSRAEQGLPPYSSRSDVISDTLDDFFSDMRVGLGIGLQYLLPVGPLRLDLAYNPDVERERGEDEFVLHFSVGTAF